MSKTYMDKDYIKKQSTSFKKEIQAIKKSCTVIIIVGAIFYGYQFTDAIRSILGLQKEEGNPLSGIIPSIFKYVLSLVQYAIVSYVIQKVINYSIRYYLYEHPISWLLNHKVPMKKHFDILFQSISIISKKTKTHHLNASFKNSFLLFVENIIKDVEQLCAFIEYRSELLAQYKLSTVILIKQEIVAITHNWTDLVEKEMAKKVIDMDKLHNYTLQFKSLLFEQIDLFKKIDDDTELLRNICMLTELNS